MKRQHFVKAIFALSGVLGILLIGAAFFMRFTALPDLAEILPEETESFYFLKTAHAHPFVDKNPYGLLPWVEALGSASVGESTVTILQVNSSQEAEVYLLSRRAEGEVWNSHHATRSLWSTVTCYSLATEPCFTWMGNLLLLSPDPNLLESLQKVAAGEQTSLKESATYQNVRSRLSTANGGFAYVDLQKMLPHYDEDFHTFEPLLAIYPGFGASLTYDQNWSIESFLAIDKTLIDGQAYWHPVQKYEARLLPWTPDSLAIEWGGVELGAQLEQILVLLQKRTEVGATAFTNDGEAFLQKLFGPSLQFSVDLAPLLDGEQYFGLTPQSDFLFLTELHGNDEVLQALSLKDLFAEHYLHTKTFQTESGEVQARTVPLTESTGQYQGYQYYSFTAEGEEVATVLITENLALVGQKQETVFVSLDQAKGVRGPRALDSMDSLLTGSDEFFTVHCLLLPEGSILKTLLSDFNSITTARKLFDDGSFGRSVVQLSTP